MINVFCAIHSMNGEKTEIKVSLHEGDDMNSLFNVLRDSFSVSISEYGGKYVCFVNNESCCSNTKLNDGDKVQLIHLMEGG